MIADARPSDPARSGRAAGHHGHGHHDRHAHDRTGPTDRDDAGLAEVLALDADLLGGYLAEATAWTAAHVVGAPRLVVDVGAGTGAGTLALAHRFEHAAVVALDRSRPMLDRVERAAREAGVADRVGAVQVDLDDGWPAIGGADVVWASSSLHEVRDPDRLLREVHDALAPGGVLVVVEMDSLPRFLPEEEGRGVEARVHAVLDRAGWNHHPDWGPHLERAGFEVAGRRRLPTAAGPSRPAVGRYADTFLRRLRAAVDGDLTAGDLAVLDRLLDTGDPRALLRRGDLVARGSRTAWAARRR